MHIASRCLDVHLEIDFLLMHREAVVSSARGSHGTFKFWNLFSSIFIIPFIFEENPDGTLILLRQSNLFSFSSLDKTGAVY